MARPPNYVAWILAQLEAQEAEIAEVRRTGSTKPIKEDSLTVKELINLLYHRGSKTISGLAKELYINSTVIAVYTRYMRQVAIVSLHSTRKQSDHYVQLEIEPDRSNRMPEY